MSTTHAIAGSLLAAHACLLGWASWHTSPTLNEVAHLPAGLYAWTYGRFDVFRVNPPLVRSLAAVPAVLGGARADWSGYRFGPGERPEWTLGKQFIRANPVRWRSFYAQARWAVVPVSLVGGLTCYLWSSRLYGPASGLLSLTLWCFSPSILAWAATITPDVSAAAFGVLACYRYRRWLDDPDLGRAIAAGAALGLAELAKMTWIILFPLWPVLWLVGYLGSPRSSRAAGVADRLAQLGLILALGLCVVNLGYGFAGSFKRLDAYTFVSRPFAGSASRADDGSGGNRFSATWAGRLPVPVPEDYLLGLDLQQLEFDRGVCCYLNGRWYDRGFFYYYLYALLVKEPLGTWLLGGVALVVTLGRGRSSPGRTAELTLVAPALAVVLVVSAVTSVNQHFRYVLPALPFAYIWIGKAARLAGSRTWIAPAGLLGLVGWSVVSSLAAYPHDLSYFNELAGGPIGGHAHLVDSNIDWGQDLFDLKRWYDQHPRARPLHVAYFGAVDPAAAGIDSLPVPEWPPAGQEAARAPGRVGPRPGWHAVSVNHLRGYHRRPTERPAYAYLLRARPVAMAGYSIYIFHISADEANVIRLGLGLPAWEGPPPADP